MDRVSGRSHPYYQSPCEASGSCSVGAAPQAEYGLLNAQIHSAGHGNPGGVGACGSPAYGVPAGVGACGSPYYGAVQGHVGAPRHGGHHRGGWWGGWGWPWAAYAWPTYNYSNYYQDQSQCVFDQRSGKWVCTIWDGTKWIVVS